MAFVFVSRFLTLVLLLLLSFHSQHCLAKCHVDDETGLLAFKSGITQDPSGMLSSWKSGTECCSAWFGVSCSSGYGKRVTSISLYGQLDNPKSFLSGTISPSLSKIRYLTDISLTNLRNITGTFPTFLYNLPDLSIVYIENNKLSGPLPVDIGKLFRLFAFGVSGNRFTGSIPSSISQLTKLSQLKLDGNLFTGQIPDGIREMKNLTYLNLEKNQFSGKIPDFFTSLTDLRILSLGYNKLTGELPPTLSALAPLLRFLEISHNVLTGKIPDYLSNFQQLDTLDLSSNQLTGTVPTSFKNLTKIFNLNLRRNRLVDPFPELNVRGIESLDLSYNKFNLGTIPKWVETSPIIYSLKLSGCGLKFRLEDFKPKQTYFYDFIELSDNQISGSPVGLLNQTTLLKGFWASGNQLRFNMSNLIIPKSLKNLVLARNQVLGKVPQSISGLKKVDLSHNHLCGQLPVTKFPAEAFLGNDCLCGSPLPPCKK
ncbi:Leucine-rich repeat receptor protein kinase ems1 [Thalictrum thalictroides]|uniref:Leucine-rich repeat receptor protein kinase ems1 n=1 Tax=Thalictrum thalictroides TaxID=46969 RepID=A0A7J6VEJ4_THATH|nr:Leucine-rich repeat receptor protein kinase ems1 [Thalictrum thalictroides]